MADYESGAIYFTGLGSGTDFDSIIEATIEAESYKLDHMEEQETYYEEQLEYLQTLNSAVLELSTLLKTMDTVDEFLVKEGSSTSDALGVSVASDAEEATHSVTVNQLAQTDVWVNTATGESASTDVITASNASFTYTYAGESYSLDVAAGTTLEGLASLITNNQESDGEVRASLIYDGQAYYLKIYGLDQGANHALTVADSTIAGYGADAFENTQTAQNAQLKVDGYPPGQDDWIERDSNSISDVIDGVSLTLYDSCTDARVNVTVDTEAVLENIATLVEEINTVLSYISTMTAVETDDDETTGSAFTGNYAIRLAQQNIKMTLAGRPEGFDYYDSATGLGDLFSALSQIGISTDADEDSATFGLLVIDDGELEDALAEDPDAVARLFSADGQGESLSQDFSYVSSVTGITDAGTYGIEYGIVGGAITWATVDGKEAIVDGWEITAAYDTPAEGLTVRVDNTADGTYSGQAAVKQGVLAALVDVLQALTSADGGAFQIMEDSYNSQVDNLADRIESEEERLATKEEYLRERYAALEATLGEYDDLSETLDTLLEDLDS